MRVSPRSALILASVSLVWLALACAGRAGATPVERYSRALEYLPSFIVRRAGAFDVAADQLQRKVIRAYGSASADAVFAVAPAERLRRFAYRLARAQRMGALMSLAALRVAADCGRTFIRPFAAAPQTGQSAFDFAFRHSDPWVAAVSPPRPRPHSPLIVAGRGVASRGDALRRRAGALLALAPGELVTIYVGLWSSSFARLAKAKHGRTGLIAVDRRL